MHLHAKLLLMLELVGACCVLMQVVTAVLQ
jgi:hypothetical protein